MSKETKLPAIPNSTDPAVKALKEATEVRLGRRGDPLDRGLTVRDLYENGVITVSGLPEVPIVGGGTGGLPISPRPIIGDTSQPPAPTSLVTAGGFTGIIVSWSKPQRKDLTANVYRNTVDNISTAVLIGIAAGEIFSDSVSHGSTYYYWVRFVSAAEVTGPFNATAGTIAVTSTINDAIPDATINVAKIANLVVDMANVTGTLTAAQFAAITIAAEDIVSGYLSADRIDTSLLNVANMFLSGTLNVNNTNGAIAWGKTSGDDFNNTGLFFGRTGGQLRFNMGSSTSYIYFDGTTVQMVGTQSVAVAPAATTQYVNVGTYIRPLIGADVNRTINIKILGGGGGGGGGAGVGGGGAGAAGGSTTVRVKRSNGTTRHTYTVGGGQGGPVGDWNGIYNTSPYNTYASHPAPYNNANDYGGRGQSVSQGGIFNGSGGGGYSNRDGTNASGNGAGGGGFGDWYDNICASPGIAGAYAVYNVGVSATTDYIEITVGGGGGGSYVNYGQGDYKGSGSGVSGAAQINLS